MNGEEIRRNFPTRRAAEAILAGLKQRKVATSLGLVLDDFGESLDDLVERYIVTGEARGLAPETLRTYRILQKRLREVFGNSVHPRLRQKQIDNYVAARHEAGVRAPRIAQELRHLSAMIRHTVGRAYVTREVPRLYERDTGPKPIPSDAEVASVYRACANYPELQRAILLALLTALRPSNACALTSANLVDRAIVAGMQKRRGSLIAVPVVGTLADALKGVEGRLTLPSAKLLVQIRKVTRHDKNTRYGIGHLRPTAATWASEAGYPDESVGLLLGHELRSTARKHYIRSRRVLLKDPFIPVRRELLEAVEDRFLAALGAK